MTQKNKFNQCVGNSMIYSNFNMLLTVCTSMLNADGELYVYIVCVFLLTSSSSIPRYPLSDWFLPVFGTVDTGKGWTSQVCPRAIGGITTRHKMRHSLSLPTVTYICMGELPHFHHSPTTSFLHSQPIQAPPSGPGFVCAAGQTFIWDDPSVTPLSWSFTKGVPPLYQQCGTSILFWGVCVLLTMPL